MALARCGNHRPRPSRYGGFALPIGFPNTAAICGRVRCEALARLPALRRRLLASYGALAPKASGSPGDARGVAAIKSAQKAGMATQAPPERNPERVLEKGSQ